MALETSVVISSELDAAERAGSKLLDEVAKCGYRETVAFAIKLAVEEAINNAIKHGNKFDPEKRVDLAYDVGPDQTVITITDQGDGFDLGAVPDPTADENLEKPTGRGIMLMRAYMDEVEFNDRGNQVRMVKRNK